MSQYLNICNVLDFSMFTMQYVCTTLALQMNNNKFTFILHRLIGFYVPRSMVFCILLCDKSIYTNKVHAHVRKQNVFVHRVVVTTFYEENCHELVLESNQLRDSLFNLFSAKYQPIVGQTCNSTRINSMIWLLTTNRVPKYRSTQ